MTKQEKADKCLQLVKEGKTYREIGEIMGITRTYVYLLLKEMHREEVAKIHKKRNYDWLKFRKKKEPETIICQECGRIKEWTYYKPQFCSHNCFAIFRKKAYAYYKEK